jgi:hypothetical protein
MAYKTVDEGITTDTASDMEPHEDVEQEETAKPEESVVEGILSSDEEKGEEVVEEQVAAAEPKAAEDVSSFKNTSHLFEDEGQKDRMEHEFGYSEHDIEEYAARIEMKTSTKAIPTRTSTANASR